jgi:hypothetical protein
VDENQVSYSDRSTKDRLTDQSFWQFSEKKFESIWPGPWEPYGLGQKASDMASWKFDPFISHTPDYRAALNENSTPVLVEVQGTGKGASIPGWKFKEKKLRILGQWNRIHETTFWLWDNETESEVWTSWVSINLIVSRGLAEKVLLDGHRPTWALPCDLVREHADTDRLWDLYG